MADLDVLRNPATVLRHVERVCEEAEGWTAPAAWATARRAVRAGRCPRPDGDAYIRCLIGAPGRHGSPLALLRDDPELLEHEVWRLFQVEGDRELSLATFDKFENSTWSAALVTLAAEGRLDRGRLLDASLDALARDFPAFRAGWFARLHLALGPTDEETAARAGRLLDLLAAPVPATVSFAVDRLLRCPSLDADALVARIGPALTAAAKKPALGALRLLERAGRPDAAGGALGHASRDVRERAAALSGLAAPAPGPASVMPGPALPVLRVAPVAHADELADVLAPRLEGVPDAMGVERALDGIARLCGAPLPPELAPLVTRARRRGAEDPCARALLAWAGDPVPPLADPPPWDSGRHHRCFELRRADEVARRAATRRPAARLALPTDTTGRVDPAVLDARCAAADEVDPVDLQQAELRAGRGPADPPLHAALEPVGSQGHLLHVGPSGDPGPADGPPASWLPALAGGWLPPLNPELDPLGAERLTLLWPDGHEWRASVGLRLVVGGEFAAEHAMPLLRVLQLEGRPVGPIAALFLARALNSPGPAVAALATDAVEVVLGDGRLAPQRLGDAFGQLLAHGLDGELRWPARLAPLPGAARALDRALAMVPDPPPRALHKLLEPLDELAQPLGDGRQACERLARGATKTARLARSLLSR